ncbi:MAG: S9 family peptidase [Ignavibacteria bacterium]|nr:S9 family peptidase [Ignavibacteria bacterium]
MKTKITILIVLLFAVTTLVVPQKRGVTLDDIYRVKGVSAPHVSPTGEKLLFTVGEPDMKKGKSTTSLFIMSSDGSSQTQIDFGKEKASSPFWGKDDNTIYFERSVDDFNQLFSYSIKDKKEEQLTSFYGGISSPVFSNDFSYLLFSAEVYPDCGVDQECNKINSEAASDGPVQAYLADELLYRHWTFTIDGKYTHTFLFDLKSKEYKDITPGKYHTPIFMLGGGIGFAVSPDGNEIALVSNREKDQASTTNSDIWIYSIKNQSLKNLTEKNKAWDGTPIYSPDGKYLAYRKQLIPAYEADKFRISLYNRVTGEDKIITESFDNWINDFIWANDSKTIYFSGDVKGYSPIFKLNINSEKFEKITKDISVGGFAISHDDKSLYYTYRLMHLPAEIYSFDISSSREKKLTSFNDLLLSEVDFVPVEQMWIDGAEGKPVHVLIVKPHNFDANKKYPLIVNVHGGPQSQWMDAFRGDGQVYSGYGYVVAFPNPHGSTGYGQEYTAAISKDWGGKVYEDVIAVTAHLSKLQYIDKDRIGAMGWSYGGYMMNWLQAKSPERYKCFVSMMSLYNLESFYGTTEELWFPEWDLKGSPWNSDLYKKFSPSNYVDNFSTPTLIISGEKDYRVSYNQSLEYFTALQKKGIDSRLIIFKNDGHWPSHVKSMPLYYNAHLEWFNKYLGGDKAPYDSELMVRNRVY